MWSRLFDVCLLVSTEQKTFAHITLITWAYDFPRQKYNFPPQTFAFSAAFRGALKRALLCPEDVTVLNTSQPNEQERVPKHRNLMIMISEKV